MSHSYDIAWSRHIGESEATLCALCACFPHAWHMSYCSITPNWYRIAISHPDWYRIAISHPDWYRIAISHPDWYRYCNIKHRRFCYLSLSSNFGGWTQLISPVLCFEYSPQFFASPVCHIVLSQQPNLKGDWCTLYLHDMLWTYLKCQIFRFYTMQVVWLHAAKIISVMRIANLQYTELENSFYALCGNVSGIKGSRRTSMLEWDLCRCCDSYDISVKWYIG